MAISDILSRRVRARPDEDDDDVYSNESGSSGEVSDAESDAVSDDDDSQSQDVRIYFQALLTDISFTNDYYPAVR